MRVGIFAAVSFFGIVGLIGAAAAAPQVLMVVTPSDEMPLTCENGTCSTEVAAICLQPDRANPVRGKNYSVKAASVRGARSSVVEDTIALIGIDAGGRETILPVAGNLRIKAERDHFAVTLSADESLLQRYGLASLSVRVTGNVLLFPDAEAGDDKPQTASDMEIAQTTLRGTAERILKGSADKLDGASVVRSAINALPRDRATKEAERVAARSTAMALPVSASARDHAKEAFFACRSVSDLLIIKRYDSRYSYRDCLGIMHDELIDGVNKEYWEALKAGT